LALNSGVVPPSGKFISYFIAEDGLRWPNQRAIAGPTGSYAITVEKSFDLKYMVARPFAKHLRRQQSILSLAHST